MFVKPVFVFLNLEPRSVVRPSPASLVLVTSIGWSKGPNVQNLKKNLIRQLFHSHLLDMRLVIVNRPFPSSCLPPLQSESGCKVL